MGKWEYSGGNLMLSGGKKWEFSGGRGGMLWISADKMEALSLSKII
jgi:hypothetical protein